MKYYDTLGTYRPLEHVPIQYGVCRDYGHLCRYRGLRQLVHDPSDEAERFVSFQEELLDVCACRAVADACRRCDGRRRRDQF